MIRDILASSSGLAPVTSPEDFDAALLRFRKPCRLDHYRISPMDVCLMFCAYPLASYNLFSKTLGHDQCFSQYIIRDHVAAKKSGCITADQTRAIVPFPTTLALMDIVVAKLLEQIVDVFAATVNPSYLEVAKKHRQILDLTFSAAMHIEKSLDCHGRGAVAQADVRQFYDHLCPIQLFHWIRRQQHYSNLAAALLRLHTLPLLELSVGSCSHRIDARTLGVFTGTRSAGVAARIPLLDVALALQDGWPRRASSYNNVCCAVGSYVDNLVSLAASPSDAMDVLEEFGYELNSRWQLSFGAESKEFIVARGFPANELDQRPGWKHCDGMRCLGHWLSSDGGTTVELRSTIASMWKCFYANLSPGLRASSQKARLNFINSVVRPLASWKWARWPWQKTAATRLDQTQTHMIGILFPVHSRPDEIPLDFFRRRSLLNGRLATSAGRWSRAWATAVVKWHGHFTRDHANCQWALAISAFHDGAWLAQQRALHNSRTRTRATLGKPHLRWLDGYEAAKSL